jgi:hypothetical protein
VLYIDVAKVDQDVTHVVIAIQLCFKVYVPNVSSVPDICCTLFYLDIAKVDLDVAYTSTLQVYIFKCFQMFHTYVCKYFI